jgi:hypothetical protein
VNPGAPTYWSAAVIAAADVEDAPQRIPLSQMQRFETWLLAQHRSIALCARQAQGSESEQLAGTVAHVMGGDA